MRRHGQRKPSTAPPEDQQQLYDPENEEARKLLADNESNGSGTENGNSPDKEDGKKSVDDILQDLNVVVNNNTITVGYTLRQDATVTAMVCDISGVIYRQQSQTGQTGDHYQMTILCDGLRRGQYVLYMNVNGQVTSQTISL